ncbi:MAG: cardiolipin synthase ClsB [Betaproteobacteria bacterium]|nr:cardiolipin synthase ClsB [Betaproteobacteria bacterium]MDE2479951.1 cardiolipin synthase ClsB [Betaproteobacteria bacterium]
MASSNSRRRRLRAWWRRNLRALREGSGSERAPLRTSWRDGNCVELLPLGQSLFPALLRAWGEARSSIWVETYIFHDDATGLELAEALIAAARRGVQVRVLVDGLGSNRSIPTLRHRFEAAGVEFMVYRPWRRWIDLLQRGHWRRLHRKMCVVDARVAFVGGINLIDDCYDIHHGWSEQPRLDYAVSVQGPVVAQVLRSMRRLWLRTVATGSVQRGLRRAPGPRLLGSQEQRRRYVEELRAAGVLPGSRGRRAARLAAVSAPAAAACAGGAAPQRAALVLRDNLLRRRSIEHCYIQAIDEARESVLLVCPYFYPGQAFRDSLKAAALRGVRVSLLLQGRADYRAAAWAAQALYRELIDAGVSIHEYQKAYLHGKVAVVDEAWATVGSSNIDPLSLLVNREANVVVRDAGFAGDLARHVREQMHWALPIDQARLRQRVAWWTRPLVGFAARLFIALAGGTGRY